MMNRRDFLAASGGIIMGAAAPSSLLALAKRTGKPIHGGWVPSRRETRRFKTQQRTPYFAQAAKSLAGTGSGKQAFLWKFFERTTGEKLIPHEQTIGDCVSHGWGLGIDILDCVQIAHGRGRWKTKCATEPIYAGGRVEVGGGTIKYDGMHGSWAAEWCRDYGVLLRRPYLFGKYDFTTYSGSKARSWAHNCDNCTNWGGGVPDELEPIARRRPVKTVTLVKSWEEARDAIFNGYPVAICSTAGFSSKRDEDGFAEQNNIWYHCMLLAGIDDNKTRPGGLIINSWGPDWISGPTRFGQPAGSFWVDAEVIDRMVKEDDSFAMSNYNGYRRQRLDYHLF